MANSADEQLYSMATYTYTAGLALTFETNFTLGVLDASHVEAYVVGELDSAGEQIYRDLSYDMDTGVVTFTDAIEIPSTETEVTVIVQRTVPKASLYLSFAGGADVTKTNIDIIMTYNIMAIHEMLDGRIAVQALLTLLYQTENLAEEAAASAAAAATSETNSATYLATIISTTAAAITSIETAVSDANTDLNAIVTQANTDLTAVIEAANTDMLAKIAANEAAVDEVASSAITSMETSLAEFTETAQLYATRAEDAAGAAYAIANYFTGTRVAFAAQNTAGTFADVGDGSTYMVEGYAYIRDADSTVIPDLLGWRPGEPVAGIVQLGGVADDSDANDTALNAMTAASVPIMLPKGYYPNTLDATFTHYPGMRNYSGGVKYKSGIPTSAPYSDPMPLVWVEKASNAQRVTDGTKYFDVGIYSQVTLDSTATAFGVGIGGHVRSSAGTGSTSTTRVDAIGVNGSGKAVGEFGRVWGLWGQVGTADDGSGTRPSQLIACELNMVNTISAQPHPETLTGSEGSYRGLVITTADSGYTAGIGLDLGDGSGRTQGESGWWFGIRLRRNGILPTGSDWKTSYYDETMALKIEGTDSTATRYGAIKIGPTGSSTGTRFVYGINMIGAAFQDNRAIHLGLSHRIFWGDDPSTDTSYMTYDGSTGLDFRNFGSLLRNGVTWLTTNTAGTVLAVGSGDCTISKVAASPVDSVTASPGALAIHAGGGIMYFKRTGTDTSGWDTVMTGEHARPAAHQVASLPSASTRGAGTIIYVTDESGGDVLAYSDGSNWRRVTDRTIVS